MNDAATHTRRVLRGILKPIVFGLLMLYSTGCTTPTHTAHKQDAQERWEGVRGKVKRQLGRQQLEAGHVDSAIEILTEAIALNAGDPEAYVLIIRAFLERGDLAAAERALNEALRLGLRSAELHYLTGVVAERTRMFSEAVSAYRRARTADPTRVEYVMAEAECLIQMGRVAEAQQLAIEAIDQFDRDGSLDVLLADTYLLLGDRPSAAEVLRRAMPVVGDDPLLAEQYGLLCESVSSHAEAVSVLTPLVDQGIAESGGGVALRSLVRSLLELGRADEAEQRLQDWLRGNPSDAAAWVLRARAALARGDSRGAQRSAEAALRLVPGHSEATLMRAYSLCLQDRHQEAVAALERCLERDPQNPLVYCLLGEALAREGLTEPASRHFRRALQLEPSLTWARQRLAELETGAFQRQMADRW